MSKNVSCYLLLAAALLSAHASASEPAGDDAALAVFQARIMPIFQSPNPSSCVQCHLSSVNLKDYIQPSHEETFVSLRDQGLIDLEHPEQSKILDLIAMGERDLDKGAQLIHARTRNAEYEAFAAWIKACCSNPAMCALPASQVDRLARPDKPDAVIRHARKDRLLDSFVRNVWSQRMRCYPCHTPHELEAGGEPAEQAVARYAELKKQYGARIDIFRETPAATMKTFVDSSRSQSKKQLPLINVNDPSQSLLVLKPTSKLPPKTEDGQPGKASSLAPVFHGGGLKMHVDDHSYKAFMAWIQDYANVVQAQYDQASDLPADNWHPTEHVLRINAAPEDWGAMTTVQLFVHAWDEEHQDWHTTPKAFTQGTVTPRGMVNGSLFLIQPQRDRESNAVGASQVAKLEPGKYLIKVYIDKTQRVKQDPTVLLNDRQSDGEAVVEAQWREGFRAAEVVNGESFQ